MTTPGAARLSNALGLLAAMLYFATFLAVIYGVYQFTRMGLFLDATATAYPFALACSVVLFLACAAIEGFQANLKKMRSADKHASVHSLVHR